MGWGKEVRIIGGENPVFNPTSNDQEMPYKHYRTVLSARSLNEIRNMATVISDSCQRKLVRLSLALNGSDGQELESVDPALRSGDGVMNSVSSVCTQTPRLHVFDPRAKVSRRIEVHRRVETDLPLMLIEQSDFDVAGREIARRDPRLFHDPADSSPRLANYRCILSLSGQTLRRDSADAGWRAYLRGSFAEERMVCDAVGNQILHQFDDALRVVAVVEQVPQGVPQVVERFSHGLPTDTNAAKNLVGQVVRHDHTGGTSTVTARNIAGIATCQNDRLLRAFDHPDWPIEEAMRETLLEPGGGGSTHTHLNACREIIQRRDARGNRRDIHAHVSGRVRAVALSSGNERRVLVDGIEYDAQGRLIHAALGNHVNVCRSYHPADGCLSAIQAVGPGGSALQDIRYIYDPVGNLLGASDAAQPARYFNNQCVQTDQIYQYDALYRLVQASGLESAAQVRYWSGDHAHLDSNQVAGFTEYYDYDVSGNLRELRHVGAQNWTRRWAVSRSSNRSLDYATEQEPSEEVIANAFDACGNRRQLADGQTLFWDARNRLSHLDLVTRLAGTNDDEHYIYGAEGMRLKKVRRAQASGCQNVEQVVYFPDLRVHRLNDVEVLSTMSLDLGCCAVRMTCVDDGSPVLAEDNLLVFGLMDHCGSVTVELDEQASVVSHELYYPFGGTAWWATPNEISASCKRLRYSGKECDASGLYDFGRRCYAHWLARWISADPAWEVNGLNLFGFCGSNPINRTDPDGRMWSDNTASKVLEPDAQGSEASGLDHAVPDDLLEAFFADEPQLIEKYGLPVLDNSSDEPAQSPYASSPPGSVQSQESGSPLSSPGSVSEAQLDRPLPPGLDYVDYGWNMKGLLERNSFARTVYRASMQRPETVQTQGFDASRDFTAVPKMIRGQALIVAETLEGAIHYARAGGNPKLYNFYEIDAAAPGASLNENWILNNELMLKHLGAAELARSEPLSLEELTGEANLMHEAHIDVRAVNETRASSVRHIPHSSIKWQ